MCVCVYVCVCLNVGVQIKQLTVQFGNDNASYD